MDAVCPVCPHACSLADGEHGRCGQRIARDGQVVSQNYGQVSSIAVDPVEKKPLYHFHPGRQLLSVGSLGCNFNCSFCQNHHIAAGKAPYRQFNPAELVQLAHEVRSEQPDCVGVAFTYNEPIVGYEWVRDVAQLAREQQLATVLVTNGFMNPTPWRDLLTSLDALNIDVKAFSEAFYQEQCGGRLAPVLRNVEVAIAAAHVELTYLVIPGLNDQAAEVRRFASWLAAISPDVPVHFTRYFPSHRLHLPPTPISTLYDLQKVAKEQLSFVYLGNTGQQPDTICPQCGNLLVIRGKAGVSVVGVSDGHCDSCQRKIPGVGL